MKNLLASLLSFALLLAPFPAPAQVGFGGMLPGPGTAHSAGGGGFTGVADVLASPIACWSLRACSTALATSAVAAVDVRNSANTTTTTIHVTSTGGLSSADKTTSGCTSLAAGCKVTKVYNQINPGTNDCVETNFSVMPSFDPDGLASGKAAMLVPTGQGYFLACGSIGTQAAPWSMAVTIKPTTTPGANNRILVAPDPNGIIYNSSGFAIYAGGVANGGGAAAAGSYYAVVGGADATGTGGAIRVNGTDSSPISPGNNSLGGVTSILGTGTPQDGYVAEWVIWGPPLPNSTVRGNLVSNMRTWGSF